MVLPFIEGNEVCHIEWPKLVLGEVDFTRRTLPAYNNAWLIMIELVSPILLAIRAIDWKAAI